MIRKKGISAYLVVTASYWAFMLTDGALRMLVLLHFHTLGFSPIHLAYLFVVYEIAGIFTNLYAGWLAARFGLTSTLYAGLALQVVALLVLSQLNPEWALAASVVFVMFVQGASGVAKDLTKMSAKSAVKVLTPDSEAGLFRMVAVLTGSKNAVKGLGFLVGASALAIWGFVPSLVGMAVLLSIVLACVLIWMPSTLSAKSKSAKLREVISKSRNINWLSAARVFLFGARDVWFVVGIPLYFYAVLSDGSTEGNRAAFFAIGGFMAIWTILYGFVQATTPRILRRHISTAGDLFSAASFWSATLALVPLTMALIIWLYPEQTRAQAAMVVGGLLTFGLVFAINSSLHSYLILSFTDQKRVTMDVGFYYMANATGRLVGTLLSGISYQLGGLMACLAVAGFMLLVSRIAVGRLQRAASSGDAEFERF